MTKKLEFTIQTLVVILLNIRFAITTFSDAKSLPLTIAILLISLFLIDYRHIKVWWGVAIITFTGLIIISANRILDAWNVILMMYCLRNYPLVAFSKINLFLGIITLICACFMLKYGYIAENVQGKALDAVSITRDLGFGNPNSLGKYVFFLIANVYIISKNKSLCVLLLCLVVSFITFKYCGSRTYLLAGLLMSVLILIRKAYSARSAGIIWVVLVLSAFFFYYNSIRNTDPLLDIILSGRLRYINSILSNFSISNYITGYTLLETDILDNAYISMLCMGGISYFIFFLYVFVKAFLKNYEYQKLYIPVTISIIATGFMESGFVAFGSANILLVWLILIKNTNEDSLSYNPHLQCSSLLKSVSDQCL